MCPRRHGGVFVGDSVANTCVLIQKTRCGGARFLVEPTKSVELNSGAIHQILDNPFEQLRWCLLSFGVGLAIRDEVKIMFSQRWWFAVRAIGGRQSGLGS